VGDGVRDCGECIACCVYPRITELNKPGLTHCSHVTLLAPVKDGEMQLSSGCENCTIYENRPKTCRDYTCLWLAGYGRKSDRPDKSLMLIDNPNRVENAIECKPLSPEVNGEKVIRRFSRATGKVALVTSFKETRLVRVVGKAV